MTANVAAPTLRAHNGAVDTREIVDRIIATYDPLLASRILRLLWSYERGSLRHRLLKEPLHRRKGRTTSGEKQPSRPEPGPPGMWC
jgi:hypothetical protein